MRENKPKKLSKSSINHEKKLRKTTKHEEKKLTKTRPAKETELHSMMPRHAETRKKKMNHLLHFQGTQKNTHTLYSFAKSKERPKLPAFHPIIFLPPPSFSVSGYSIILRILKFLTDEKKRRTSL
jgi:hypothetical protein